MHSSASSAATAPSQANFRSWSEAPSNCQISPLHFSPCKRILPHVMRVRGHVQTYRKGLKATETKNASQVRIQENAAVESSAPPPRLLCLRELALAHQEVLRPNSWINHSHGKQLTMGVSWGVPNLAGEFFLLPRGFFFLICSVFRPLHLSCHFPSMPHAVCSILELEPFILRVICSILELNLPCCMRFAELWRWNFLFCMLFAAFGRRNLLFIMLFAAFARRNLSVCLLFVEFGSWNLLCCCICCYVCCCCVCCCAVCCCNVCCCFFVMFVVAMFVLVMFAVAMVVVVMVVVVVAILY